MSKKFHFNLQGETRTEKIRSGSSASKISHSLGFLRPPPSNLLLFQLKSVCISRDRFFCFLSFPLVIRLRHQLATSNLKAFINHTMFVSKEVYVSNTNAHTKSIEKLNRNKKSLLHRENHISSSILTIIDRY